MMEIVAALGLGTLGLKGGVPRSKKEPISRIPGLLSQLPSSFGEDKQSKGKTSREQTIEPSAGRINRLTPGAKPLSSMNMRCKYWS